MYTADSNGKWSIDTKIAHRQMSNNSVLYDTKPAYETLKAQMQKMRYSGEPGWVNREAGRKRLEVMTGVNPCAEILLPDSGTCNLTTINLLAFVKEGKLDYDALYKAQALSARACYRMTCLELELPAWDAVSKEHRLLGCSLTGWYDMVNATNLSEDEQIDLLNNMRRVARESADAYADSIGSNRAKLVTSVKPEGTLSQLPTVSSGLHASHSPFFIRRVRVNAHDPLVKVCEELGYNVLPEVGQKIETCTTKVVEFVCKAPNGKTKNDLSALEQLDTYLKFMEHYVDHNASITIHVRDHEWEELTKAVYENWDKIVAVSFLPLDDSFYELLPYEAISEEEYERRASSMQPFNPKLLAKYEKPEEEFDILEEGCTNGVCPIR